MRLRLITFAGSLLIATPAAAQMPQMPPTLDDRVAAQIGALVLQSTRQAMQIEMLQKQLAEAQAKLAERKPEAATPPK